MNDVVAGSKLISALNLLLDIAGKFVSALKHLYLVEHVNLWTFFIVILVFSIVITAIINVVKTPRVSSGVSSKARRKE